MTEIPLNKKKSVTFLKEKIKNSLFERELECKPFILLIDGPAASGKSTLAKELADNFAGQVIHMDDFFLPLEKRTTERLKEPGGNVDYERYQTQVIDELQKGQFPFHYSVFDCSIMEFAETRTIIQVPLLIVEGSYSLHPIFGNYYDLSVFLTIDSDEQLRRLSGRNSPEGVQNFIDRWIPMEERYFDHFKIAAKADYIIDVLKE